MRTSAIDVEKQGVVQLTTIAGNLLADNMPAGVQFLLLAYTDKNWHLQNRDDYLVCFRSQQDKLEAAQMLRQMADSIEDGLEDEPLPLVGVS